eukprot:GHVO01022677.1.p1 GENE.GHVO01022677.1~~GHVO01022677.1.p1  ORF type:complete len:225 (+),score=45.93 GHVO01022677.1:79-753(+)
MNPHGSLDASCPSVACLDGVADISAVEVGARSTSAAQESKESSRGLITPMVSLAIIMGSLCTIAYVFKNKYQSTKDLTDEELRGEDPEAPDDTPDTPVFIDECGARHRVITKAELAKSKTWTLYKGKVYSVAKMLNRHPGGANKITKCVGCDISKIYDQHHSSHIERHLEMVGVMANAPDLIGTFTTLEALNGEQIEEIDPNSAEVVSSSGSPTTSNTTTTTKR